MVSPPTHLIATAPPPPRAPSRPGAAGFTLVEVVIVVAVLGILAALVMPRFINARSQAETAAAQAIARQVQVKIQEQAQNLGDYPDTIDPSWFAGGLPQNPWQTHLDEPVHHDAAADANQTHPRVKFIRSDQPAFWYNPANGKFRVLVPTRGGIETILDLYNEVNGSKVAVLTDVSE